MQEMWETQIRFMGQQDPLEKGMATHFSILACKIPWRKEPSGVAKSWTHLSNWALHICQFQSPNPSYPPFPALGSICLFSMSVQLDLWIQTAPWLPVPAIPQVLLDLCASGNHSSCFWRRQWHPTPVLLPGKSHGWRSLVGCSHGVGKSQTRLSDLTFTFHFHALEKEMATHSNVLAWRIPGTGKPGGLTLNTESDTTEPTYQQQPLAFSSFDRFQVFLTLHPWRPHWREFQSPVISRGFLESCIYPHLH